MDLWCSKKLVVAVTGPNGATEVKLPGPFARVGSHRSSDIVLEGTAKRSLYIHATDDGVFCLDLSANAKHPSNGSSYWLTPGSPITIGSYVLTVALDSPPADRALPSYSLTDRGTTSSPIPLFRINCKSGSKARYRLQRALTVVGRDVICGLSLSGTRVSSPHCVLYCERGCVWCIDLLSGNGTSVNGQRCDVSEIKLSDRLGIGEFRVVYSACASRDSQSQFLAPPVTSSAELSGDLKQSEPLVADDRATVRLGKGDTVHLRGDVAAGSAGHETTEPLTLSPSANESIPKGHVSSHVVRELERKVEEQELKLAELRQLLEKGQQEWLSEREGLRKQLREQTRLVEQLQDDLAISEAAKRREMPTKSPVRKHAPLDRRPPSVLPESHAAVLLPDSQASNSPEKSAGRATEAKFSDVKNVLRDDKAASPLPSSISNLDVQLTPSGLKDRQGVAGDPYPMVLPEGGTSCNATMLDDSATDAAERETIQLSDSAHGTVIWHAWTAAIAGAQLPGEPAPTVAASSENKSQTAQDAMLPSGSTQLAEDISTGDGPLTPGKPLRDDSNVLADGCTLESARTHCSRTLLTWVGLALVMAAPMLTFVLGWWILGR